MQGLLSLVTTACRDSLFYDFAPLPIEKYTDMVSRQVPLAVYIIYSPTILANKLYSRTAASVTFLAISAGAHNSSRLISTLWMFASSQTQEQTADYVFSPSCRVLFL